jgi:L-threonylcarbamoyladenylate synthase
VRYQTALTKLRYWISQVRLIHAKSDNVVAKLYAVKGRPSFNSLIAHIADLAAAARPAGFNDTGRSPGLAGTADPGARALLGRRVGQGGLDTIAVRVPSHPVAQQDSRCVQ